MYKWIGAKCRHRSRATPTWRQRNKKEFIWRIMIDADKREIIKSSACIQMNIISLPNFFYSFDVRKKANEWNTFLADWLVAQTNQRTNRYIVICNSLSHRCRRSSSSMPLHFANSDALHRTIYSFPCQNHRVSQINFYFFGSFVHSIVWHFSFFVVELVLKGSQRRTKSTHACK